MTQHRCTNPGYVLNGVIIQEFASLGMSAFKGTILFLKHVLKMGWLNHKKYYNEHNKCIRLENNARERGVKISNHKTKQGLSKSTEYRHLRDMTKTMKHHGNELNKNLNSMKHRWVTYQHNRDSSFFDNNPTLAQSKQQHFNQLQKQLWDEYHNNPQHITNLTLHAVNRKQSYRDIQESRVAVCDSFTIFLYVS